jgi:hypothetical protein
MDNHPQRVKRGVGDVGWSRGAAEAAANLNSKAGSQVSTCRNTEAEEGIIYLFIYLSQ